MAELTRRQKAIYEFIVRQVEHRGMPPTLMEIAAAFGLSSVAGVADHLKAIERKGYIRRRRGVSRGIELARLPERRMVRVPIVGEVPSTRGIGEAAGGDLLVDARALGRRGLALRAGASLPGAGILAGDHLLVDPERRPRPGDLLVGRQGARVFLLRYEQGGRARALAGEPRRGHDIQFVGRVVGVFRTLDGAPH